MYESIVRWRTHPDLEKTFDALFGCADWRKADECDTAEERRQFLHDFYVAQLQKAGMKFCRSFEMKDEGIC